MVLPAYAGVILAVGVSDGQRGGSPRIRGGDPRHQRLTRPVRAFSPHTRG